MALMPLRGERREDILQNNPPLFTKRMDCCGIVEVSSELGFSLYRKNDFHEWLKRFAYKGETGIKLFETSGRVPRWRAGILLATTVPPQRDYISWLKKVGFKEKETFLNMNTHRKVTLWTFSLKGK